MLLVQRLWSPGNAVSEECGPCYVARVLCVCGTGPHSRHDLHVRCGQICRTMTECWSSICSCLINCPYDPWHTIRIVCKDRVFRHTVAQSTALLSSHQSMTTLSAWQSWPNARPEPLAHSKNKKGNFFDWIFDHLAAYGVSTTDTRSAAKPASSELCDSQFVIHMIISLGHSRNVIFFHLICLCAKSSGCFSVTEHRSLQRNFRGLRCSLCLDCSWLCHSECLIRRAFEAFRQIVVQWPCDTKRFSLPQSSASFRIYIYVCARCCNLIRKRKLSL